MAGLFAAGHHQYLSITIIYIYIYIYVCVCVCVHMYICMAGRQPHIKKRVWTCTRTHTRTHALTIVEVFVVTHDLPGASAIAQIVVDVRSFVVVQRVRVSVVVVTERPHLTYNGNKEDN